MLQNWTTTLIDDLICLLDYIHHVRYHLKPVVCLFIGILFVTTVSQERAQGDYIRRNVKNKYSNIASLFEIQHDLLFRRISV